MNDFRAWLKSNRRTLAKYTPDEIAHLALDLGFDFVEVVRVLSHFRHALQGSDIEKVVKMQIDHYEDTIKRIHGLSLTEQWHGLANYERGITWGEK